MIIGINGNEANIARRVGVNMYAYELLKNLSKLQAAGKTNHKLIVYLQEKPLPDMPEETANFKYKIIPGGGLWILTKLMPYVVFGSDLPDVLFTPSHYAPPICRIPQAVSIMDLGYLEFSEQFTKKVFWQLKWWTAISIYASKAVIAISNSTKNDIVRHYTFAEGKVYVTQLACDDDSTLNTATDDDVRRVKKKYSIVDDYILYIGTLKPSKNIEGLIAAFSKVSNEFPKLKLVIAGKKGWLYETIHQKVESLGLTKRIVFTDYVGEEDKAALRKGAKVFAQPSFWEGFGIDTLSAMSAGVPVVASNTGSLPEVVGEAGVLIDPYNIESIAKGILKVLSMSKTDYNSMVRKGKAQAGKFSWEKTAQETLKIIEDVQRQNR